jgi:Skp family chaperone for outer membrane proteins
MRDNILREIREVVSAKAKSAGYTMVFDTAGQTVNMTPLILYTNGENDITDDILKSINANAPPDLLKTDTKDKSDEKKTDRK